MTPNGRSAARAAAPLRRALVTALAATAVGLGPLPQLAHADTAPATAELKIPAQTQTGPVGLNMAADSADGYVLSADQGTGTTYTWHSADGAVTRDLGVLLTKPQILAAPGGTLLSVVAAGDVAVYDVVAGTWTHHTVPTGQSVIGVVATASGWCVITHASAAAPGGPGTGQELHELSPAQDGGFTDLLIGGVPATGMGYIVDWRTAKGAMMISYSIGAAYYDALIDAEKAMLTFSGRTESYAPPVMNDHLFGAFDTTTRRLVLRSVQDPRTVAADLTIAQPHDGLMPFAVTKTDVIVGRQNAGLMWRQTPGAIASFPLDGSAPTELSAEAGAPLQTADGGVVYDAATGSGGWATYKLPADGGPAAVVRSLATYHPEWIGLSLDRGRLNRVETGPDYAVREHLETADVGAGAVPAQSARADERTLLPSDRVVPYCADVRCYALTDPDTAGGGLPAHLITLYAGTDMIMSAGKQLALDSSHGRIVSADHDAVVYDSGSNGLQYLVDLQRGAVVSTRPISAATLWNGSLWSATTTPGTLSTADPATGTVTGTVSTDAPCIPDEIQVLGKEVYWSCGASGPAGVYDTAAHRSVRVPAGHALLGDGFVLRHAGGSLVLTDVHTGTAAADRTLAALPAGAYPDDRGITWTVDKYRGFVAYTGTDGTTHVLPSGVPHAPLAVLRSTAASTAKVAADGWQPQWTLTGPVSSWRVDLRRKGQSPVVKSFSGGATRNPITVTWDGKSQADLVLPNAAYTWTLSATPADAQGPALSSTGTVALSGGPVRVRDFTGDGIGDLFALTSGGKLDLRPGTGTTPPSVAAVSSSGTGWPSTSLLVPTGDLNGDGANDLLVRNAAGQLTRYDGTPGHAFTPTGPHTLIGGGWNTYNLLTSPGDTNDDGRPDLVARDAAGHLYFYAATAAGTFAPRRNTGYGWQVYDMIVGVQDLRGVSNFPESGNLLARDRSGVLWEYGADGHGHFGAGSHVGGGWNVYNAIVGAGDLDGDGRHDVLARDTHGDLWLYRGNSHGYPETRVKVGWGWQAYKSLL